MAFFEGPGFKPDFVALFDETIQVGIKSPPRTRAFCSDRFGLVFLRQLLSFCKLGLHLFYFLLHVDDVRIGVLILGRKRAQ